jgi:hypothetical protein
MNTQDNSKEEINPGLPDNENPAIENRSGSELNDSTLHNNSSNPADQNDHVYSQGTEIHLAYGPEKYLPNEAWGVIKQKQGRVEPINQSND